MPADVAIAGAGLIGASIAWRLAQAGARVTLFDAGAMGGEASSAGAGMLSPGGEFDKPSVWLDLGVEGMSLYPDFVDELRSETGLPIDFQIRGCLKLNVSDAHRRAEFQAAAGIQVEVTPGGLFYPGDGFVNPNDLLAALRRALRERKVQIFERHPISEIEATGYAAIVIAAGAWSGEIEVRYRDQRVPLPGVIPIKGHLIGFDLEPGTLGPMVRRGPTYVLQRSNGFTIAGSNEEQAGFDRSIQLDTCESIHRAAAELFPALARATPSQRWIGFRPYCAEGPQIRCIPGTNVWLAYGHYRNGILLAPLTAQRISEEISGRNLVQ